MTDTLADAYPREQARLRDLLTIYRDLGPIGAFGYAAISDVASRADKAAAEGDTIAMIGLLQEMRGCE